MSILVLAPHPDDEVIGCFEVLDKLKSTGVEIFVAFSTGLDEVLESSKLFGFTPLKNVGVLNIVKHISDLDKTIDFVFAPDPTFELHPLHKEVGSEAIYWWKRKMYKRLIFYSTNMNAPYIHEVQNSAKKRRVLDLLYKEKSSLWEYDHKYFLFEGRCEWLRD